MTASNSPKTTRETHVLDAHAASFLPEHGQWKLVWNDEFDGDTLDDTKWMYRTCYWGRPSPTFTTEGVTVHDGSVHLSLIRKGDDFFSPHLQTGSLTFDIPRDGNGNWPFGKRIPPKFMHRFGYYEARCRLPKNQGWHAAFWMQSPSIGAAPDPKYCGVEVDVMENYRQHSEGKMLCGCGYGGYGKDCVWPGHFQVPFVETPDGWHIYGVDWQPDGYDFYMDGQFVGRQCPPNVPVSFVEQFLLISTECHGYHAVSPRGGLEEAFKYNIEGKPLPILKQAVLPDEFTVDYVRVFDNADTPATL